MCLYLDLMAMAIFGIKIREVYGSYYLTPASEGLEQQLILSPKWVALTTSKAVDSRMDVFSVNYTERYRSTDKTIRTCLYELSAEDVANLGRLGWIYNPDNFSSGDPRWSHRVGKEGYDVPRPWCFETPTDECEEKVREYLSLKYKYFKEIFETCRVHGATSADRIFLLGMAEIY